MSSDASLAGAPLTIRVNRRARRLRLRVDQGGLVLTVPRGVSRRRALEWAASHSDWAVQALDSQPPRVLLAPGAIIPFRGEPHRIEWSARRSRRVEAQDGALLAGGPLEGLDARLLRWLRAQAGSILTAETRECAAKAGLTIGRVGVGDARTRWGSCSSSGAIRYNWRLILAPDFVRRATVAHEVAHLVHMNHSPAFHAVVADLLGADAGPARAWLRSYGAALHRIG